LQSSRSRSRAAVLYQRRALARFLVLTLKASRRLTGLPRRPADALVSQIGASLSQVVLGKRDLLVVLAWSLANWALDCSCLVFAYLAVGAGVPWRGLLLAYGRVSWPRTSRSPQRPRRRRGEPVIALVAFGGGQISTVAAVLLYRIVSFWDSSPSDGPSGRPHLAQSPR